MVSVYILFALLITYSLAKPDTARIPDNSEYCFYHFTFIPEGNLEVTKFMQILLTQSSQNYIASITIQFRVLDGNLVSIRNNTYRSGHIFYFFQVDFDTLTDSNENLYMFYTQYPRNNKNNMHFWISSEHGNENGIGNSYKIIYYTSRLFGSIFQIIITADSMRLESLSFSTRKFISFGQITKRFVNNKLNGLTLPEFLILRQRLNIH